MTALGDFTAGQVLTAADLNAIGTWTTYTPVVTQGATTITAGANTYGHYARINDMVFVQVYFKAASSASAAQIKLSTPVSISSALTALSNYGSGFYIGGGTNYTLCVIDNGGTSTVSFVNDGSTDWFGISPSIGVASGDTLTASFCYKAA